MSNKSNHPKRNQRRSHKNQEEGTEVVSNYNFVPAPTEEEVFVADWADQISHDIPFVEGESGEITVEVEAKTPIFIRNGHAQDAETHDFSHIEIDGKKKYFIPSTSLKGMIRNNLEIMSFSKLTQFNGEPFFGLRDLNTDQYKQATAQTQIKSGWLKKEGDNWKIFPVDHGRVSMNAIEQKFRLDHNSINKADNAINKYRLLSNNQLFYKFSYEKDLIKKGKFKDIKYGNLYKFSENGDFQGELVFYGNINNKHYDFIFQKEGNQSLSVDKKLVDNLDRIEKDKEISLWKYFRNQNKQRIPVFFRLENNKVVHFGMSKLYTQNNGKSIKDISPKYSANIKDLATSIFGNVEDELKGRVFFSNSNFAINFTEMSPVIVVLNSPKASYYPFYLKQNGETYSTYVSTNPEMRGFKKYPVHSTLKSSILNADNTNIQSSFTPLPSGTTFQFKLRYFNLKPIELGALLSALTFHGNHDKLFHSLGGAKPLGYGKVKLDVKLNDDHKRMMKIFEEAMDGHLSIKSGKKWIETAQIIELFAMASEPMNDHVDSTLRYPILEKPNVSPRDANEFVNIKKAKPIQYLEPYSFLNTIDIKGDFSSLATISIESDKEKQSRLKDQEQIINDFNKYTDFSKYLNEQYDKDGGFSNDNIQIIESTILRICENHKDSFKKLQKDYDWNKNISKWIGDDKAKELRILLKNMDI